MRQFMDKRVITVRAFHQMNNGDSVEIIEKRHVARTVHSCIHPIIVNSGDEPLHRRIGSRHYRDLCHIDHCDGTGDRKKSYPAAPSANSTAANLTLIHTIAIPE